MDELEILFLAANPTDTTRLQLDHELREIEQKLDASRYGKTIRLRSKWAVRPDDLLQALNDYRPHIVHFSGHGSAAEEIVLLDKDGHRSQLVSKKALVGLFEALADRIRLVVLNACYSRAQADAISQVVDCTVGMRREIADEAAITFAASFYRAIGFGRSVKNAFDQGVVSLRLHDIAGDTTPELVTRPGADATKVVLVSDKTARGSALIPNASPLSAGDGKRPIRIFYVYSHADEELRAEIEKSLSVMRRQGLIETWHDRKIAPGTNWNAGIGEELERADVILLLVSNDFLASEYIWEIELKRAMERHNAGTARVVPIILRPCEWAGSPFARLQSLPKDGRAVTAWRDRDEALLDVARGVRRVIEVR